MNEMYTLRQMMTERYTEEHFEAILLMIDRLHDASAVGQLQQVSALDVRAVIGWLDDIIFTAEETIRELQEARQLVRSLDR